MTAGVIYYFNKGFTTLFDKIVHIAVFFLAPVKSSKSGRYGARNAKQLVSPPDGTSIDYLAQGLVTMDILVKSAV